MIKGNPFMKLLAVGEARDMIKDALKQDGKATCPCCATKLNVQRRTITAHLAKVMIEMYNQAETGWVYIPSMLDNRNASDFSVLKHWQLVENRRNDDNSYDRGWWKLTARGEQFVLGQIEVPRNVYTFQNKSVDMGGGPWTIKDALGKRFRYDDFMQRGV